MSLLNEMADAAERYAIHMQVLGFTEHEAVIIYESLLRENTEPAKNYQNLIKEILAAAARCYCTVEIKP